MLKKCLYIIALLILVVPVWVNAETIKDGDTTYLLEEVKIESEIFNDNTYFMDMTEDGKYIYDVEGKYYKVALDGTYELLTPQEKINLMNIWTNYEEYIEGKTIYRKEYAYHLEGYLKTTDTELVDGKTYYKFNPESYGYDEVETPDVTDIASYYEEKYFTANDSATIDTTKKYYRVDNYPALVEVVDPVADNVTEYYVEVTTTELEKITKLITLDANKFADVLANYEFMYVEYDENSEVKYIVFWDTNNNIPVIYNTAGKHMENVYQITTLSEKLKIVSTTEDKVQFWNKEDKVIYVSDKEYFYLYNIRKIDNVYHLFAPSHGKLYTLTEYSVASGNDQTYKGKDLKITFSDEDIKTVRVNGKELKSSNYKVSKTSVTLKKSYLALLTKGTYTVEAEYENGVKVSAKFVVKSNPVLDDTPQTGNINELATMIVLFTIAVATSTTAVLCYKKR